MNPALRLLLITEGTEAQLQAVRAALAALAPGGVLVQLRDKELAAGRLFERARSLRALCSEAGAPLVVNGRADVALAAGADGVHLPGGGLPVAEVRRLFAAQGRAALVGTSCHAATEVVESARASADYAVFGPVFAVPGKGPAQGLPALAEAARAAPIPLFALGGVGPDNAAACLAAGARGVACIRSVLGARDPAAAARALFAEVAR